MQTNDSNKYKLDYFYHYYIAFIMQHHNTLNLPF